MKSETPTIPAPTIERFELGPFATNSYLVSVLGSGTCWIIDPSFEPEALLQRVREEGLTPEAIVLTHAHVDHIAGIPETRAAYPGVPVWVHEAEQGWLEDPELNLSIFSGVPVSMPGPDRMLKDGEALSLAGTEWRVLHTPGHSPGGVALYCAKAGLAVSGDALFAGSIGRTDFPGCDFATLERSIRTKLYGLPPQTVVYPGHGPKTTIQRERTSNPFVHD